MARVCRRLKATFSVAVVYVDRQSCMYGALSLFCLLHCDAQRLMSIDCLISLIYWLSSPGVVIRVPRVIRH